jgi:integrase
MNREKLFPEYALVKGKVGERQIPLTRETYEMLCQLRSAGPLFQIWGHRMPTRYLYDLVHALMLRAGLKGEKLGPHILRHTAATEHILAGGSERALQQELGHTTPIMTALYSHLAEGQLNTEHQRVNLLHRLKPQEPSTAGAVGLLQTETSVPAAESLDVDQPSQGEEAPAEKRLVFGIRTRKI